MPLPRRPAEADLLRRSLLVPLLLRRRLLPRHAGAQLLLPA
jgi:hypothetical protein